MLITMLFSLLNSKLYKYDSIDSPAFAISYIIMPCIENQAAKLAFERLSVNDLGKKRGASIFKPRCAPAPAVRGLMIQKVCSQCHQGNVHQGGL